jgi:hypothetical protein
MTANGLGPDMVGTMVGARKSDQLASEISSETSPPAEPTQEIFAPERVDHRLAFLARASARLLLVEAGELDLDQALDGLVEPICECQRWPLAAQWERTHPPRRRWRRA